MSENYALAKFGIDEIYIHENFTYELLEQLYRRAVFSLDGEDNVAQRYASHDMVLVFYKKVPSPSIIYQFLKHFHQDPKKESFIESNTLINEEELLSAIKSKQYVLVTHRNLVKETHTP